MSTVDFEAVFIGGPMHGRHKRVPLGTVTQTTEGVRYVIRPPKLLHNGKFEAPLGLAYFFAEIGHLPDGVDVLRGAIALAKRDRAH